MRETAGAPIADIVEVRLNSPAPWTAVLLVLGAAAGYYFAFAMPTGAAAILLALPCLFLLGHMGSTRSAFYGGLLVGMAIYIPHLLFFKTIFGPAAFLLWLVAGFPIAVFLLLVNMAHRRLGESWAMWLTPLFWTGLEYFRSELWALKFSWIVPGQAAAFLPGLRILALGVYGVGFLYALVAAMVISRQRLPRAVGIVGTIVLGVLMYFPGRTSSPFDAKLHVAGMQMEFPDAGFVAAALDSLARAHPEAQILVLSEYTFQTEPPQAVRDTIRKHRRYLIVGGVAKENGRKYNTAFVIGPDGREVFRQVKSVPVQFFTDGEPASS